MALGSVTYDKQVPIKRVTLCANDEITKAERDPDVRHRWKELLLVA